MSLTRANTSGWVDKDLFTATQANHMDTEIIKAPDFVNGGSYTPGASVDVAGSGVRLMGTLRLQYASRTISRALRLSPFIPNAATNYRNPNASEQASGYPGWALINLTNASPNPRWAIDLPNRGVIDKITVYYKGTAGHAAFPGGAPTMPQFKLVYFSVGSLAVPTTVFTCTDTSASAAAYEAYHAITQSSVAHTIDNSTRRYALELIAESGANYIANGAFFEATADVIVTDQSEWQ